MERGQPYIRLKLDIDQPIELAEFVGAFTALASEFERYVRQERPDLDPDAALYVKEVRGGSVLALLVPLTAAIDTGLLLVQNANALATFVKTYGELMASLGAGARAKLSKRQYRDIGDQVAAVASIPNSGLEVAAMEIIDGNHIERAAFYFNTAQAQAIRDQARAGERALDEKTGSDRERVLMTFGRTDRDKSKPGKRSGELVWIEAIEPARRLPLIYASDLAEQRIKHEIAEAEDNVYKKGFIVDVNIERRAERAIAYRVTHLHQVIDLDEEQ